VLGVNQDEQIGRLGGVGRRDESELQRLLRVDASDVDVLNDRAEVRNDPGQVMIMCGEVLGRSHPVGGRDEVAQALLWRLNRIAEYDAFATARGPGSDPIGEAAWITRARYRHDA
jgi:hypothetical protein